MRHWSNPPCFMPLQRQMPPTTCGASPGMSTVEDISDIQGEEPPFRPGGSDCPGEVDPLCLYEHEQPYADNLRLHPYVGTHRLNADFPERLVQRGEPPPITLFRSSIKTASGCHEHVAAS